MLNSEIVSALLYILPFMNIKIQWFVMTVMFLNPFAEKVARSITPPPTCLTAGMRCFCWYAAFGFCSIWSCVLWPKIFTLISSVQRTLLQKSCGLFRHMSENLSNAAMFFSWQPFQMSHSCSLTTTGSWVCILFSSHLLLPFYLCVTWFLSTFSLYIAFYRELAVLQCCFEISPENSHSHLYSALHFCQTVHKK